MKSGHRTLQWDTPMPAHVHRRHEPPTTSDNYGAIRRAADEKIGDDRIRANDTNSQTYRSKKTGRRVACGMHWRAPAPNGYTRIKRILLPGTRKLRRRELHRTTWTWEQVRRWRRPNGELPRTLDELYAYGALHGVVQIVEEKSSAYADRVVAHEAVAAARRHDHPAWFMVLITMAPRGKVAATVAAGGQIALIFGNFQDHPKPDNWADWSAYPTRIWGPARAQRWLP